MIFQLFVSCDCYILLNLEHIFLSHKLFLVLTVSPVCLKAVPILYSQMTSVDFRTNPR